MNQKQRLVDTFTTPVVCGVAAAIGSVMLNGTGVVPMFGYAIPSTVAVGLTAASASLASGVLFNYAIPHLPGNMRTAEAEKLLVKPVISGLANYGMLKATVPDTTQTGVDFLPAFGTGAVAELVAQQSSNAVKSMLRRHI